jgi:rsbT co-antagonist protein RsbR
MVPAFVFVFKHAPVGLGSVAMGGKLERGNQTLSELLGYPSDQLSGRSLSSLVHPDDEAALSEDLGRLASGTSDCYQREVRFLRSDGRTLWVMLSGVAMREYEGGPASAMFTYFMDVSRRHAAEIAARESEERMRLVADLSSEALVLNDGDVVRECNAAATTLLRARREQLIGRTLFDFIAPELHATARPQLVHGAPGQPFELELVRLDGTRFPAESAGRDIPYNGHTVRGIVLRDLSERRSAAAALRQSVEQEAKLRAQAELLQELSAPLIPLSDGVMVMPLIGMLDRQRAAQVLTTLLEGLSSSGAHTVILDLTGVRAMDSQITEALSRAAQAVRLLGAQVILTGIRAEVAQLLVSRGTELPGLITRSTLQSGIAYAMQAARKVKPGLR